MAHYSEAVGGDEHLLDMTVDVYANDDHPPPTTDQNNRHIVYVYRLRYNGGSPGGSEDDDWRDVEEQGKFPPSMLSEVTGAQWGGENPHVTEAHVRALDANNH